MAAWLFATHVPAVLVLPGLGLDHAGRWALAGLLLGGFVVAWTRHVTRRHRRAPARLVWSRGDALQVCYADGATRAAHLDPRTFLLPWLVILRYRSAGRVHSLPLLPDMTDADTFRRLRVRLRCAPPGNPRPEVA